MLFVGTLTYSIYMMHPFVRSLVRAAILLVQRVLHIDLFIPYALNPGNAPAPIISLHGSFWLGDLLQVSMLLLTILLSAATYRFVERPGRDWARRLARRDKVGALTSAAHPTKVQGHVEG